MRQVLIQAGNAIVSDVPAPTVGSSNILVRVEYSCVSVGTEMAGVRLSGLPLYKRALKQPENVRRVLQMVAEHGVRNTMERVGSKLAAGSPTGYSASGTVIEVGPDVQGFSVGDRVACAGAGIANHAEIIDVPVNLAVVVPDGLSMDVASSVTLGAIALQGVRRAQPTLGETFVVVGLGILGQLTVQMLLANGCNVIGVDPDPDRLEHARMSGMGLGINPSNEDYVDRVAKHTDGFGADGVIITAASGSNEIIRQAMQSCRRKGRVVLVGDVGLQLQREDFYKKELDFFISTSYGPGRYDPGYEEGGRDYPIAYVRWTENRNMAAFLDMLSKGRVSLDGMFGEHFDIADAGAAYAMLKQEGRKPLMVFLRYPGPAMPLERRVEISGKPRPIDAGSRIRVAVAGASSFAQSVHLPNMAASKDRFEIAAVMSRTGSNAKQVATQFGARYCTTDYQEILRDPDVDLIMVATRHDLHASMALQALQAGKHVFVEKPLALKDAELREISDFFETRANPPLLMVGYNRRFSPAISEIQKVLKDRGSPLVVNYRMNAGFIPGDHWVHGPEGGGRNIGEACHIYDLFIALCGGARPVSISAHCISPRGAQWATNDNFVAVIKFSDGSVCSLTYTSLGEKSHPKERMEVFADGRVIVMDDYKSVYVHGRKKPDVWSAKSSRKGHPEELAALASMLSQGGSWPIPLEQQFDATRISLEIEKQIRL